MDLQGIEAALDKAVTPEGAIKNHEYVVLGDLVKGQSDGGAVDMCDG